MIAKRSKLKLLTTDILESNIIFHPSGFTTKEVMLKMSETPINIDFEFKVNEDGLYYIFVKMEINNDDSAKYGYSISVYCASVFDFEDNVNEEEKKDLISSGVNITITNLRGYIYSATSYYPLGPYNFHLIDMQALLTEKVEEKMTDI